MSIIETTTRISRKWLERKTKYELADIIIGNLDRIEIFADGCKYESELARLTTELAARTAERDAARQTILDHENRESSVCPEDVGFVEYIRALEAERDGLAALLDFVIPEGFDNDIVDMRRAHGVLAAVKARVKAEGRAEGLRRIIADMEEKGAQMITIAALRRIATEDSNATV